jgi:uncharacterized membrane protein AbrB (regulator of aidB expression)
MDSKYLIGIVIALVVLTVLLMAGVGYVVVRKNGFDGFRTMLGESKLDKLISKINKFIGGR